MSVIKINQKNYEVPELVFAHMTQMEDMGFNVIELFRTNKIFSLATAFTGVVTGLDREDTEELLQQHILGGGNFEDIYKAFTDAMNKSAFFKKLLNIEEEKPEKKTVKAPTPTPTE